MSKFGASVQYKDWFGEIKADDGYSRTIRDLLNERGLVEKGEFVIGFSSYIGENRQGHPLAPAYIHVLLISADRYEEAKEKLELPDPIMGCRQVEMELPAEEFLRLFKRFSIAVGWMDLPVVGRDFEGVEA